jgi:hypothetical protein
MNCNCKATQPQLHQSIIMAAGAGDAFASVSGALSDVDEYYTEVPFPGRSILRASGEDGAPAAAGPGESDDDIQMTCLKAFGALAFPAIPEPVDADDDGIDVRRRALRSASRQLFVDPIVGSDGGDGSRGRPWKTLAAVAAKHMKEGILLAGDTVFLRRGYHGAPVITGRFAAPGVTVVADNGHTPCIRSLVFDKASFWTLSGIVVTQLSTPAGHADTGNGFRGIAVSSQSAENCDNITLHQMSVYNAPHDARISTWDAATWKARAAGAAVSVFCKTFSMLNCHIYNAGGLQLGFHASPVRVVGTTIENFASDGMGVRAGGLFFENNCIMGSYSVDGNHNDLCQVWASRYVVFRNNWLIGQVNPAQRFTVKPGMTSVQGLGAFDGWKEDWVVDGNVVMTDHPIGIWFQGYRRVKVRHNTVLRCGPATVFRSRLPCIHMGPSKSGGPSSAGLVANNFSESYELEQGVDVNVNNVIIKTTAASSFVDWRTKDVRITATAPARGRGDVKHSVDCPVDICGFARVGAGSGGSGAGGSASGAVDCGAFAFGSTTSSLPWALSPLKPSSRRVLSVTAVAAMGFDIAWEAHPADEAFEILFSGTRIGIARTRKLSYMWLTDVARADVAKFAVNAVPRISY